jgi:hypothetical protein
VYTQEVVFPVGTWLSLVEHSLGVRGVGSSNLPVPTIKINYFNPTFQVIVTPVRPVADPVRKLVVLPRALEIIKGARQTATIHAARRSEKTACATALNLPVGKEGRARNLSSGPNCLDSKSESARSGWICCVERSAFQRSEGTCVWSIGSD